MPIIHTLVVIITDRFQVRNVTWLIAWQTWQNIVILFVIFSPLFSNAFSKTDFLRLFFFGLPALLGALQLGQ
jgi:hypothetical protein